MIKENPDVKYAKIPFVKIGNTYTKTRYAVIGIGRVLSTKELKDKISVYSDDENVYLEKTE